MEAKPDPEPISRQVRWGLKIGAAIVVAGVVVFITYMIWLYLPSRALAYLWHLWYGNSIAVGQYRFPVPQQWYVQHLNDGVLLTDLDTGDTIMVDTRAVLTHLTLSSWAEQVTRLQEGLGWKTTGRRDFQISGESYLCLEQDFDMKLNHAYPIECRSSGVLEVTFQPNLNAGKAHHEMFYSLLRQVQKTVSAHG